MGGLSVADREKVLACETKADQVAVLERFREEYNPDNNPDENRDTFRRKVKDAVQFLDLLAPASFGMLTGEELRLKKGKKRTRADAQEPETEAVPVQKLAKLARIAARGNRVRRNAGEQLDVQDESAPEPHAPAKPKGDEPSDKDEEESWDEEESADEEEEDDECEVVLADGIGPSAPSKQAGPASPSQKAVPSQTPAKPVSHGQNLRAASSYIENLERELMISKNQNVQLKKRLADKDADDTKRPLKRGKTLVITGDVQIKPVVIDRVMGFSVLPNADDAEYRLA